MRYLSNLCRSLIVQLTLVLSASACSTDASLGRDSVGGGGAGGSAGTSSSGGLGGGGSAGASGSGAMGGIDGGSGTCGACGAGEICWLGSCKTPASIQSTYIKA